jgi:hypothetical protein
VVLPVWRRIQIRFVGFILTMLFTIAAHPMFWDVALQQG